MKLSAGILVGGRSRRMGRDKAFLDAGGVPLIDYMVARLKPIAMEVLISARDASAFKRPVVLDEISTPCSLAGIHALLKAAREPALFVCAVDMPYVHEGLIAHLLDQLDSFDAVLPQGESGIEPLHGIYTKACLPGIDRAVAAGKFKITDAVSECNVRVLPIRESEWLYKGHSPFTNLNLPADYDEFRRTL